MKASPMKWTWLFRLAFVLGLFVTGEAYAEPVKVRAGVLSYGTVNWELNVVKHHGLDRKEGVELLVTKLGGKNASAVALQGGAVDVIVTDWIWVSRQRAAGTDPSRTAEDSRPYRSGFLNLGLAAHVGQDEVVDPVSHLDSSR